MNIKKLFPEKKISKKGLVEFLDKKGFYVVLVLCIAIVGVTAVLVTTHNITSSNTEFDNKLIPEEAGPAAGADGKTVAQSSANSTTGTEGQKAPEKANTPAKPTTPTPAPAPAKQPAAKPSGTKATTASAKVAAVPSQKFIAPVFGPVVFEYAQDKLVYNKTLEEWRTQSGIGLGGEKGTAVKAVADGVVSEIKNDPRYGITIILDHQNGFKTVYANLASDEMITPNQRIKQGDIIGAIGETAAFEAAEPSHLHFEVLKNGVVTNPEEYLPQK